MRECRARQLVAARAMVNMAHVSPDASDNVVPNDLSRATSPSSIDSPDRLCICAGQQRRDSSSQAWSTSDKIEATLNDRRLISKMEQTGEQDFDSIRLIAIDDLVYCRYMFDTSQRIDSHTTQTTKLFRQQSMSTQQSQP